MQFLYDNRPIIALSTPAGSASALAVIRLSGFDNIEQFANYLFADKKEIFPQKIYYSLLKDNQGNLLDDLTFVFFKAPKSYTGENLLELFCHGNPIIVENIINFFISHFNFRSAAPGEFTYRALQNGKLSLSQVEGLDLLLNASSNAVLNLGRSGLNGELHESYLQLFSNLKKLKASLDISLDFSDDVGSAQAEELLHNSLDEFYFKLKALYRRCNSSSSALLHPDVVLIGEPNAGKSTLFNYLLSHRRSIVSDIKGTTRDYISEQINIQGNQFNLIDTAGIREVVDDKIEEAGVKLSLEKLNKSFFAIRVVDYQDFDIALAKEFDLVIVTHVDLINKKKLSVVADNIVFTDLLGGPIGPKEKSGSGPIEPVIFSDESGPIGPEKERGPIGPTLREIIFNKISSKFNKLAGENPILIERQRNLIIDLFQYVDTHLDEIKNETDFGVLSFHINKIQSLCEELLGIITPDEVLTSIFENFCIGK